MLERRKKSLEDRERTKWARLTDMARGPVTTNRNQPGIFTSDAGLEQSREGTKSSPVGGTEFSTNVR